EKAFQAKKALYLKKDQGLLWQVPPQKNAMDAMMQAQSDPSMATGMMKNQFMFLGIHGTLGYWVSHLFSGFLVAKTPFPLTFKVKSMLQRGVDVPALDTSYVSSLSLYFFVSMSSQGIMQLYQQLRSSGDDAAMAAAADTSGEDMMMMGGMMAPPPPPMPMGGGGDVKKAFETERENLEIVQHKFALEDAEDRLLDKWLGSDE
ncbi:ER membrane complex subunit 3, partial [Perkinsus olseni]